MLKIKDLRIGFEKSSEVVKGVSFDIQKNQILGLVGESGSGKSITSLAILNLLPTAAQVTGDILFENSSLINLSEKNYQKIRGNEIAMIFQEPMSSLNPTLTCGAQVTEVLQQHTTLSKRAIKEEVLSLFQKVKLPRPKELFGAYPHQISGGQQQRVMIAMAIACKPKLLIADEPTTALDVTVQQEIIALLKELQEKNGMSVLFISHDLALVSEIADEVVVMYQGHIVEQGTATTIFSNPKENYTKALINARPKLSGRLKKLPTVEDFINETVNTEELLDNERKSIHDEIYAQPPLLEIQNLKKDYITKASWWKKENIVKAVDDVSFRLYEREVLGLVGESGCGKSTLGKTILQLEQSSSGRIVYRGKDITQVRGAALKELRKEIQIIFQDPFSSLNPRIPIGRVIMEPMKVHKILESDKARKRYVLELLEKVGLSEDHFYRYPHEFSGGQRQRIGIARTIALQPKLIICDESVSALDVSVQAQVLNLLNELKYEYSFTYIFISHDLSVVKYMADQLMVMEKGKIVETGDADAVYTNPQNPYTKTLIEAIPKGI